MEGERYGPGGGRTVQEDLVFTARGVECFGDEREEGFDAHGFERGKCRFGEEEAGFREEGVLRRDSVEILES